LPSKPKGTAKIELSGLPKGNYQLEVYKVGYNENDAYTTYLGMKKPSQLTIQQVTEIKEKNSGAPVSTEPIKIGSKGNFTKNISINENDVPVEFNQEVKRAFFRVQGGLVR